MMLWDSISSSFKLKQELGSFKQELAHYYTVKDFNFITWESWVRYYNYCWWYAWSSKVYWLYMCYQDPTIKCFVCQYTIWDFVQVALARWRAGDSKSPIMFQDLWCPTCEDHKPCSAAVGDTVELSYTLHSTSSNSQVCWTKKF